MDFGLLVLSLWHLYPPCPLRVTNSQPESSTHTGRALTLSHNSVLAEKLDLDGLQHHWNSWDPQLAPNLAYDAVPWPGTEPLLSFPLIFTIPMNYYLYYL